MAEAKSNRFTKYFPLLLDALRSADPNPMRPAEAMAWIRAKQEVAAEDLTRFVQNGTQSIFENAAGRKESRIGSPAQSGVGLTISFLAFVSTGPGRTGTRTNF